MKEATEMTFNVNEIFYSIQGEGTRAGLPCIFVRFQGCLLRCTWCDTPYALDRKKTETIMTAEEIFEKIKEYDCKFLMLTGGEPLEQEHIGAFTSRACDMGYEVVIETNGQQDISKVDERSVKILDMKCPDSGMSKKNDYKNLGYLTRSDEVKFVVGSRKDYEWAKALCGEHGLYDKVAAVLFSPVFGSVEPVELASWILADNLQARMQLQMHKYIWHPNTRGV